MADDYSPRAAGPTGSAAANRAEGEDGWFDRLLSVFGLRQSDDARESLSHALAEEGGEDAIFSTEERRLLRNILALRDVRISDVMVPRADVEAVPESISLADLVATFREAGHSRLPVYRETLDDPLGFVHAKDVMIRLAHEAMADGTLDFGAVDVSLPLSGLDILRPLLFVPPSMPAMDLMVRMQGARVQLALVIDEYGGTDGLVSLEDLVETVVGDIEDEYDEAARSRPWSGSTTVRSCQTRASRWRTSRRRRVINLIPTPTSSTTWTRSAGSCSRSSAASRCAGRW